jgi:hypothetical protein
MKNFQVGKLTLDPRDLAILKCPQSDLPLTVLVDREGRIAISHAGVIDPLSLSQKVFFGDLRKTSVPSFEIARHKALADLRAFGITLRVRARTRGRKCYQGAVCKLVNSAPQGKFSNGESFSRSFTVAEANRAAKAMLLYGTGH